MVRKAGLIVALALLLTCGPTAVTTAPSASLESLPSPIASTDLITLRESDPKSPSTLNVRKVSNAELVATVPDGLLLPDGKTLLVVQRGASETTVKKMTRQRGEILATRQIPGGWELMHGWPWFTGESPDGSHVVLFGNSYNYTDQSGAWTAKTTFGVLDLASWHLETVDLPGHYAYEAVSNDGRLVYLADYHDNESSTRVYDTSTHELRDIGAGDGGAMFSTLTYAAGYAFGMVNVREQVTVRPDVIQVTTVNKLARLNVATGEMSQVPLPVGKTPSGEDSLAWSFLPAKDGVTMYAVNPLVGVVSEIDLRAPKVRRTVQLSDSRSAIDNVLAALHPVAMAKMEFLQGAILSPDETKIYALALDGIWSIDVASLRGTMLTRAGNYMSMKLSPDGMRLYVLSREAFGSVSAIDAQTGAMIGTMKKIAAPSDIVAVDAG